MVILLAGVLLFAAVVAVPFYVVVTVLEAATAPGAGLESHSIDVGVEVLASMGIGLLVAVGLIWRGTSMLRR